MVFVQSWDETVPPGTESISLGDNRIRDFKYAIRERLAEEHAFYSDETGKTDVGMHNKITLLQRGADPAFRADAAILYSKEVATKAEIFNMFETNNAYQWSYLGKLWIQALKVASEANKDLLHFDGTNWDRYAWATFVADLIADADFLTWASTYKNAGDIVQIVNYQTGAVSSGNTLVPYDDTVPQNTEGDQYMSLVITPKSATNILKIDVVCQLSPSINSDNCVALFQDADANALACLTHFAYGNEDYAQAFTHWMVAGTIVATTFKVRAGGTAGSTLTFNGVSGGRKHGGVLASSITITEIEV